jgi:hypothetical protein
VARNTGNDGTVRVPITQDQLIAVLDRWIDQPVAIRVVAPAHQLLAVFRGRLRKRSDKRPSLFWPVECADQPRGHEQPGVYLHPRLVEDSAQHPGETVVEWRQAGVTLNVRRL